MTVSASGDWTGRLYPDRLLRAGVGLVLRGDGELVLRGAEVPLPAGDDLPLRGAEVPLPAGDDPLLRAGEPVSVAGLLGGGAPLPPPAGEPPWRGGAGSPRRA